MSEDFRDSDYQFIILSGRSLLASVAEMAINMSASQLSIHGQLKSFLDLSGNKSRPGCKIIQNPFRKWMAELDTSCRRRTSFTGMPWLSNATLAGPAGVAPSSPVLAYQSEDPTAGCTMLAPDAVARSKYPAATHELTRQSCDKVVIGFRIPQQEFQNDFHSVKKTQWSSPLTEADIELPPANRTRKQKRLKNIRVASHVQMSEIQIFICDPVPTIVTKSLWAIAVPNWNRVDNAMFIPSKKGKHSNSAT